MRDKRASTDDLIVSFISAMYYTELEEFLTDLNYEYKMGTKSEIDFINSLKISAEVSTVRELTRKLSKPAIEFVKTLMRDASHEEDLTLQYQRLTEIATQVEEMFNGHLDSTSSYYRCIDSLRKYLQYEMDVVEVMVSISTMYSHYQRYESLVLALGQLIALIEARLVNIDVRTELISMMSDESYPELVDFERYVKAVLHDHSHLSYKLPVDF